MPETIDYIAKRLAPALRRPTKRSNSLNPINQILITLEYLASGCFYRIGARLGLISKGVVCKVVHQVIDELCKLSDTEIVFPADAALPRVYREFYKIAGIPSICGVVDGCLFAIKKPSLNTDDYMCRKDYAAINAQVNYDLIVVFDRIVSSQCEVLSQRIFNCYLQLCCGPDMLVYSCTVRWPGRINDARVFESSVLKQLLEGGNRGFVLGDSAYPLREYVMTPIRNPLPGAQESFNAAHRETRCLIERTIGVIQQRSAAQ
jgi:hypothetical protein